MSRQLTPRSSLENLRREAKRWLKALRDGDADARARLQRANPKAPAEPTLRDVQLALAREHGTAGWTELTKALAALKSSGRDDRDTIIFEYLKGAEQGDVPRMLRALDRRPEILDVRTNLDGHGGQRTALHYGVRHEAVVKALLERGANPNIRDEGDDAYPLHFAAESGHLPIVRLLIEHGADPVGDDTGHELNVLGWATCFGYAYHQDVADYLLAHGARHTIHTAVAMGAVDVVRQIARRSRADIDKAMDRTNQRRRPLHLAVVKKRPESLAALLELGADMSAVDAASLTPLDQAALRDETAMAQMLLDHGAQVQLPAAVALNRTADIERLLREDPDCLEPGQRWGTLIVRAAERSSGAVIETLIRAGASPNARDDPDTSVDQTQGYTALHAAAWNDNTEAVKVLMQHGADVRARDSKYCGTPAGWARYNGKRDAAHLILAGPIEVFDAIANDRKDRIPDIIQRDPEALERPFGEYASCEPTASAFTPVMAAVMQNKVESARVLVELGAKLDVRDDAGRSLLEVAREKGGEELVAVLRVDERASASPARDDRARIVARFLENACPDWRIGGPNNAMARHTADRLLRRHPEIARANIYTAVACGDVEEVERILRERPDAANEAGGPRGWPPLLYLANARLSLPAASENAVAIARLLLDRGADPNVHYQGGSPEIHYTVLTGVMGDGEEHAERHPQAEALVRLLLERGAEPYDSQVMYNTHFQGPPIWLLDLMYEHSVRRGRKADWDDPEWHMLDAGGYGSGARYLLGNALRKNDLALAEWCLKHGASPTARPAPGTPWWKSPKATLYEEARRMGRFDFAELLLRYGAEGEEPKLDDREQFAAAAMRKDAATAKAILSRRPELLRDAIAMHEAARLDRPDIIAFLVDLGVSPNVEDPEHKGKTALHEAAWRNAARAAQALIERGADVDIKDSHYGGTPLGWATHGKQERTIEVLREFGRDIWHLIFHGNVERVRQLLGEEPDLAKTADEDGSTLLMWLPEDERAAIEMVKILVAHGVDPAARNATGKSAADYAEQRGLDEVAELLRSRGG